MLTRIDRVQMAVPDRTVTARRWEALLGAEPAGEDTIAALAARRSRLRLGNGWIELLEPDGAGPIADAVSARGAHLFAAGAATTDLGALHARLEGLGVDAVEERGQIHIPAGAVGGFGLNLVVSAAEDLPQAGTLLCLYEVTNLVQDVLASLEQFVVAFGLDPDAFVPIESTQYGYAGVLTLFRPRVLDRIEMIHPHDRQKTMGRFFTRFGDSLYMAFGECAELALVERRTIEAKAGHTVVPPEQKRAGRPTDTLFLHPDALGGMMLGLSRPTVAWRWSGAPDRVEATD